MHSPSPDSDIYSASEETKRSEADTRSATPINADDDIMPNPRIREILNSASNTSARLLARGDNPRAYNTQSPLFMNRPHCNSNRANTPITTLPM